MSLKIPTKAYLTTPNPRHRLGSSLTYLIYRINSLHREIRGLTAIILKLREEVQSFQNQFTIRKRRRLQGFYSVTASSGDEDDDIYQDAYGGSDLESLKELTGEYVHLTENSTIDSDKAAEDIFNQTETLFEGTGDNKNLAYELLTANKSKISEKEDFYWRLAKAAYLLAQIKGDQGNAERKKELLYEAAGNASTSLSLYDSNPNSHKWYAITLGSLSDYLSTQEKIKNGFQIKEHIQRAIDLNPTDPSNHYMLGRWCYSVYMLSWIERKVAATLYASPPSATINDALNSFLEADKLKDTKWKENMLFIAKCYIELRNYEKAKEWLNKASIVPIKDPSDKEAQIEIDALKLKYG
ncbi:hypothetical protein LOTGIDRAFT_236543 [Lottia gigantea]|uniref:Regulator of microtubule dynamics protein 1 n=1 Tax=Lottia gigantea TaxID=225164 RepID=V4B4Z0_LOTGI|nr:hypothetical protein LOTGIDRAFT_236543 [Lottia gigantea]ESO83509.1 hypothetical protein LOTGIDRAFT_236543 [Lottia gigantea]